ncbi:MAG TPA: S1C family serine protease [bacterium]|nr:S1C family serine protease [bacterium]
MSKKIFISKKIKSHDSVESKSIPENINNDSWEEYYRSNNLIKPAPTSTKTMVISLVIAVFFGFLSGFLSVLLFLSGSFSQSKIFSWLDINSLLPTANVLIERQEQTTVIEDERIKEVAEAIAPTVASILNVKKQSGKPEQDFYQPSDFVANAFVLTSDGWLVTGNEGISSVGKYLVLINNKILPVENIKLDSDLGLVFLKVKAENLMVSSFGKFSEARFGERILLWSGMEGYNKKLLVSRLGANRLVFDKKNIFSSEKPYLFFAPSFELNQELANLPVFNLNKDFIGLFNNRNIPYIIPAEYIKKSLTQIIALGDVKPTYLGIEFIDLSISNVAGYQSGGALITALKKDSPLFSQATLGDVVVKIGEDLINQNNSLTNILQIYRPGDKVKFTLRTKEGIEKIIDVELK